MNTPYSIKSLNALLQEKWDYCEKVEADFVNLPTEINVLIC